MTQGYPPEIHPCFFIDLNPSYPGASLDPHVSASDSREVFSLLHSVTGPAGQKRGESGPWYQSGSGKDTQEQAIHAASHLSEMIFLG